jgi:hypothetical protein
MRHFFAVALLGLALSLAGQGEARAAAISAPAMAAPNAVDSTMTPAGWGWWAVPAVVGGVILFDHLHRYPHGCYRRCRHYHGPRYCRRACW